MKRSINIGIILFLLFQACSGGENVENQASVEPISENTPINPPPGENNPPPGENNPPPGENNIDRALQIIEDANDDVLDCINRELPTDIFQRIVNDLNPDNYEAGIIIACFEDPGSSNNIAQPPPDENNQGENQGSTPQQSKQPTEAEGNQGNSWYSLNVYEYTTSYSSATSNNNTGFGLDESGDIYFQDMGLMTPVDLQNLITQFLYQQTMASLPSQIDLTIEC